MTISMWRLLSVIALILGLIILLIIKLVKPLNNIYNYSYREDNEIKNERKGLYKYNVYEVASKSFKYIDKYIIKTGNKKKELIVDYVSKYKYISFFILQYTKKDKLLKIMKYSEHDNTLCSKPIKLLKKCTKLNICVSNVNSIDQGIVIKGKVHTQSAKSYAFFSSVALFLILFAVRELITELLCFNTLPMYLETPYNALSVLVIAFFSFINIFKTYKKIKKEFDLEKKVKVPKVKEKKAKGKNKKSKKRGAK